MMKERRCGVGIIAQRTRGRWGKNVGRIGALLTRDRLEHYQSAPKLYPEEQHIMQEDKREEGRR